MVKFVTSFLRDESGASAAEYALILAIVGSGIAVAAIVGPWITRVRDHLHCAEGNTLAVLHLAGTCNKLN
jgi:Flp pilus assembly pilin Flp